MPHSTLTSRGRTTVPTAIRKQLGIRVGTRLAWHVMPDGLVIVRAKTRSLRDMAGLLKSKVHPGKKVSIEDMKSWRRTAPRPDAPATKPAARSS